MKLFDDAAEAGRALDRPFLTIGNFDGLHVGHRAVLERCVAQAREAGAPALVMTFRPHPAAILPGRSAPARVASEAQELELLASVGIDALLRQPFDTGFASLTAEAFHDEWLVSRLAARGLVVGTSFRFGAGRRGTIDLLRAWGRIPIVDVPPIELGSEVVSSSRVRRLVAAGDVAGAWKLLVRPMSLEGVVVEGDKRGRTLGFPTANVDVADQVRPGVGVYAAALRTGGRRLGAVVNVGRRPTFGGEGIVIEAHALEDPGDLYDSTVRLALVMRLRDERRFDSVLELTAQIGRDIEAGRQALGRHPPESLAGPAF